MEPYNKLLHSRDASTVNSKKINELRGEKAMVIGSLSCFPLNGYWQFKLFSAYNCLVKLIKTLMHSTTLKKNTSRKVNCVNFDSPISI